MSDPVADRLLELLERSPDEQPCLWTLMTKLYSATMDEATDDPSYAHGLVCALNNGFRKGYWRLVVTPRPEVTDGPT